MGIIIIIIIVIVISSMMSSSKENKQTEIKEKINKGELIRLSNGEVKHPSQITHNDKIYLPDYQYIVANQIYDPYYDPQDPPVFGRNYESLSLEELKKTADRIRNNKNKIDQERRRIEQIKREEQQKREAEEREIREAEERIRYEQEIAEKRLNNWNELSSKIIFEIHTSHQLSRKSGIYVIHCIKNVTI